MRYLVGFLCVLVTSAASPLSAGAQGDQGIAHADTVPMVGSVASMFSTRSLLFVGYLELHWFEEEEGGSRLERWHPEAFVDPTKPASSSEAATEVPALQLELDSAGLVVTPGVSPTGDPYTLEDEEELRKQRRRRGIGIAVGVVVVIGVAVGAAAAASISHMFD